MKKMRTFKISIAFLLGMIIHYHANSCTTLSGSYTIDSSQPASATNFQSFTEAVSELMTCGVSGAVLFTVAPGVYYEQVIIGNVPGSSAVNTISFDGINPETTKITFSQTVSAQRYTIRLDGAKYVTLKNLAVDAGSGLFGWAFHITGGAEHINLHNNIISTNFLPFTGNPAAGFGTNFSSIVASASATATTGQGINVNHIDIYQNTIQGGSVGVSIIGRNDLYAEGITIRENTFKDQTNLMTFLNFTSAPEISGNKYTGSKFNSYINSPTAISVTNSGGGVKIFKNTIRYIGRIGIGLSNYAGTVNTPALIYNNTVKQMIATSSTGGIDISNSAYVNIWHNSIDIDKYNRPMRITGTSADIDIRNNTFAQMVGYSGWTTAPMVIEDITGISYLDYNNYFSTTINIAIIGQDKIPDLLSLKQYMSSYGFDQNSISVDPQYNRMLVPYGPNLSGMGTHLAGVATDLNGNVRNTIPSIGAYEVLPKNYDVGVTAIISPVNKDFGGLNTVRVEVTNYGSSPLVNIPVTVNISGTTVGSVSGVVPGTLLWGQKAEVDLGSFNFSAGDYELNAFTTLTNDEDNENNNKSKSLFFHALVGLPVVDDQVICAGNSAEFTLTGFDSYKWYDDANNFISSDNPFNTGSLNESTTYRVEGFIHTEDTLENTAWSITSCSAQVFELAAAPAYNLKLTSMDINYNFFSANTATNFVYIYLVNKPYSQIVESDYQNISPIVTMYPLQTEVSNIEGISPFINVPLPDIIIPAGSAVTMIMEGNYRLLQRSQPLEDNYLKLTPKEGYCTFNSLAVLRGSFYYEATSHATAATEVTAVVSTLDVGEDKIAYLGYAPMECVNLSASGTFVNDPASSLSWSHGAAGSSVTVCPSATTDYTVTLTDAYGCVLTDVVTVCTVDVTCANGIKICRKAGNSGMYKNLCVPAVSVAQHLASGAELGDCNLSTSCNPAARINPGLISHIQETELNIFPNPVRNSGTLEIIAYEEGLLTAELYSVTGQFMEILFTGQTEPGILQSVNFNTSHLANGNYVVKISSPSEVMQKRIFVSN
jgi:hypothetical protein